MVKRLLLSLFIICLPAFNARAADVIDTEIEGNKSKKVGEEQSGSIKQSEEERESKGKRDSKSMSKGLDKQVQEALKEVGQAMKSQGVDIVLPLEAVFNNVLYDMEKDMAPFKECKIASSPMLARDFGLSAELEGGMVDTMTAQNLANAAKSNFMVSSMGDEDAIREYRDCLAQYGAVIGQSYLYLVEDLNDMKAQVVKDGNGNIVVRGLGYNDFISIANSALHNAAAEIINPTIQSMLNRITNDHTSCRFDGAVEVIKCGASQLTLSSKPQLVLSGVGMYGSGYAGFSGSFKVSRGWSYSEALEKLRSTSKYKRFAEEVSKYAEEMESKGMGKEAVIARKKAVETAMAGRQAVSPTTLVAPK